MNILYISHESGLNGAPKSLLDLAVKMKAYGLNVIVVIPQKGPLQECLKEEKIRTEIIPFEKCVYSGELTLQEYKEYICKNFYALKCIVRLIKEEKVNIIHTNSFTVNIGAIGAIITNTPHIWHVREFLEEDFGFKLTNPEWTKVIVKKTRCFITISNCIQQYYEEKYGIKSCRLYNGIDKNKYYRPLLNYKKKPDAYNILLAGSISDGKGQADAIRAIGLLKKSGQRVKLKIIGNGRQEYINTLKKCIKKNDLMKEIEILPYTNELNKYRNESDIILVCSKMEAYGRVTAEAMMAGKIVIGANCGGTLELIGNNEERGYLYEQGNPQSLAAKIQISMDNLTSTNCKVKCAQEFILKQTDMKQYALSIYRIYKMLCKNRSIV